MMPASLRFLVSVSVAVMCARSAQAQVVQTEKGPVEFIGLKRWTIPMIEDSLRVHAPNGHGLWGCAVDLVSKLHFADASVIRQDPRDSVPFTVITVLEPQDSARVKYRGAIAGASPLPHVWRAADSLFQKDGWSFQFALLSYRMLVRGQVDSARLEVTSHEADTAVASAVWRFLAASRRARELELALWALQQHPDYRARLIAAAVLANFPEHDLTWWTLADALRDPHPFVASTARQALLVMSQDERWMVDWAPAASTLRLTLQGTNLFAFATLLKVLTKTRVAASLAPALLVDAPGELVFAYLRAYRPQERELALGFLRQLTGKDFGYDSVSWARWRAGLRRE